MSGMRTGGVRNTWSFDSNNPPHPIAQRLVSHDDIDGDGPEFERMLAIVMDRLLADLPPHLEEAVRLTHLAGLSQRKAAAIVGVDHKTVAARARKGIAELRSRIEDSVWLADLLKGQIPDEFDQQQLTASALGGVLDGMRGAS